MTPINIWFNYRYDGTLGFYFYERAKRRLLVPPFKRHDSAAIETLVAHLQAEHIRHKRLYSQKGETWPDEVTSRMPKDLFA